MLRWHDLDVIIFGSLSAIIILSLCMVFIYPRSPLLYYGGGSSQKTGFIVGSVSNPIRDASARWGVTSMCDTLNISCSVVLVKPIDDPRVWPCLRNLSIGELDRCGRSATHFELLTRISARPDDEYVSVFDDYVVLNDQIDTVEIERMISVSTNVSTNVEPRQLRHYGGKVGAHPFAYMIRPSEASHILDSQEFKVDRSLIIGNTTMCTDENTLGIVCTT